MHDGEFMAGKHQQMKWAMSHHILRLHKSPKWALLWGNPYKAVRFATPDMVLPHAKHCGGGPTWRDPHHPLCFAAPSHPPPCSAGVHGLLHCDESTVWVAVLPTRFVIVSAFKTTERFLFSCFFKKNQTIPQVWFGVQPPQPSNWQDRGEVTPVKQGRNPLTLLRF